MSEDDYAQKEASEVLHSLLPIERIENKRNDSDLCNVQFTSINTSLKTQQSLTISGQQNLREVSVSDRTTACVLNSINVHFIFQACIQDKQIELIDIETTDPLEFLDVGDEADTNNQQINVVQDKSYSLNNKLESSAAQVNERFLQGCECRESCFKEMEPDFVFKHRLNVAELTKEEHDMYLMGVTMACLSNRTQTHRNKERQRQRASYVFQGKRVCLDAFLYLQNVTQYHWKRIRNHVLTVGVVPRVHGNMGKKPHNTFSLDMYKSTEHFVKQILSSETNDVTKPCVITGETRSSIYNQFRESGMHPDGGKIMGYTTFKHFMKKQFPNVRFAHCLSKDVSTAKANAKERNIAKKGTLFKKSAQFANVNKNLKNYEVESKVTTACVTEEQVEVDLLYDNDMCMFGE